MQKMCDGIVSTNIANFVQPEVRKTTGSDVSGITAEDGSSKKPDSILSGFSSELHLGEKFKILVSKEEAVLENRLAKSHYRLDSVDAVHAALGSTRLEKVAEV
jgi:hypothetical protein